MCEKCAILSQRIHFAGLVPLCWLLLARILIKGISSHQVLKHEINVCFGCYKKLDYQKMLVAVRGVHSNGDF